MFLKCNNRGVSEVIGFILLFGVLVILLVSWQTFVIPSDTGSVETQHQLEVESDLQELRDAIEVARQSDRHREVTIQLGPSYSDRLLFQNPPPPTGSIQTTEPDEIRIGNATAVADEPVGTATAWEDDIRTVSTQLLTYDVGYNQLPYDPSYTLEQSYLYGDIDGQNLGLTDDPLVDGTDIHLTALSGVVSETQNSETSVPVRSTSPASRSVTVENDSGPVTLGIPTRLDESAWVDRVNGFDSDYVIDSELIEADPHNIGQIVLDESTEYDIQFGAVGVGSGYDTPEPAYLASPTGDKQVYAGGNQRITAEVRDEFDNILRNENLTFTAEHGGEIEIRDKTDASQTVSTGTQGTARVKYIAPDSISTSDETDTIVISHDSADVADIELTMDIRSSGETADSDVRWDDERVEMTIGETRELTASDFRNYDNPPATFDVENQNILQIQDRDETFEDGNATVTVEAQESGKGIHAYVSSLGAGDRLPIDVTFADWIWESVADWTAGTNERTVTDDVGDREADTVRLGYPATDDGLVGYWPLDETSGNTAIDYSGLDNNGTHQNDPTLGAEGILSSTSYQFDGVSEHITIPHDESLEMSDDDAVSVSMWVNQNQDLDREWTALLQKSDTAFNLQLNSENEPVFTIHDGDWTETTANVQLEQDRWYHIVGTYDGTESRIYVDGEREGEENIGGEMSDASDFDIGIGENLDSTGRYFDGQIDEVRLYDEGLDEQRIDELYETAVSGAHTTGWKTGPRELETSNLTLRAEQFDLNGETITVSVESSTGEVSDPITFQSGVGVYSVEGIETDNDEFRIVSEFETADVTETAILSKIELTDEDVADSEAVLSDLDIAGQGNEVTLFENDEGDVSVTVENVGNEADSFVVDLSIENGKTITDQLETDTIEPGETETILFDPGVETLSADSYDVTVSTVHDELTGQLTVQDRPSIDSGFITDDPGSFIGATWADYTLTELDVTNPEGVTTFRITFDNQDDTAFEEIEADTVDDLIGANHAPIFEFSSAVGDEYEIAIELLDEDGNLFDEILVVDTVDGNDISF